MTLSNHGMLGPKQNGIAFAILMELGLWNQRSAADIYNMAYLWKSNSGYPTKEPERMDDDFVRKTNRLCPSVLRNRIRSPYKVYRHLMGMCNTNGGYHVIRYGNRRHHVNIRVARSGTGTHDVEFRQTLIKVEVMTGRGQNKNWEDVTQEGEE